MKARKTRRRVQKRPSRESLWRGPGHPAGPWEDIFDCTVCPWTSMRKIRWRQALPHQALSLRPRMQESKCKAWCLDFWSVMRETLTPWGQGMTAEAGPGTQAIRATTDGLGFTPDTCPQAPREESSAAAYPQNRDSTNQWKATLQS